MNGEPHIGHIRGHVIKDFLQNGITKGQKGLFQGWLGYTGSATIEKRENG